MAACNYHVVLSVVLLFAWILNATAWTHPDSAKVIEKKWLNPFDLTINCGRKPCKFLRSDEALGKREPKEPPEKLTGMFAGGFGKRGYSRINPEQATKLLCLIARCKTFPDEASQSELKRNVDFQEQYTDVQDED